MAGEILYETFEQGGIANLVENIKGAIGESAEIVSESYSPNLTAGAALSMVGDTVTEATWTERVTDAVDGVAVVDGILGKTVVWNQLTPDVSSSRWSASVNVTKTVDSENNSITITSNTSSSGTKSALLNHLGVADHKYYVAAHITNNSEARAYVGLFRSDGDSDVAVILESDSQSGRYATVGVSSNPAYFAIRIQNNTAIEKSATFKDIQLVDLTAMFGAGNEPSTVAEFEALFPEPYYPYDAGSLLSVQMEGIETVGFNQWDEEWEVGGYNSSTGAKLSVSDRIRSKNAIPVFPSTEYFFKCTSNFNLFYYDTDGNFVSTQAVSAGVVGKAFTTPANAYELRFALQPTYGTTYNHNICINVSDPTRNGEYEPYHHFQRTIPAATYFPDGMRSAGTVHDELTSDAAIVRVGAVDLGTLDWVLYEFGNEHTFRNSATTPIQRAAGVSNLICAEYSLGTGGNLLEDMQVAGGANSATVYVRNNSCTTAAEMKLALDGVILYYALATSTITTIDPPLAIAYRVENGGTESVMHTSMTTQPTWRTRYPFDQAAATRAATEAVESIKDSRATSITVGAADALTATGGTESTWMKRVSEGGGVACVESVKGNTLVWNQIVPTTTASMTSQGVTVTGNGDGSVTISGTCTDEVNISMVKNIGIIANHRYLIRGGLAGGSLQTYYLNLSGLGYDYGSGDIFSYSSDIASGTIRYTLASGVAFDNDVVWPQLFDLTRMFGAGNEPSTVAEFEALYPEPYYPYDAGSLLSVQMEGIETVGFNQWDEEWEVGSISTVTGNNNNVNTNMRSKNYCAMFPNTEYCFKNPSGGGLSSIFFYDSDKKYLGYTSLGSTATKTFTSPAQTAYFRFAMASAYGTTYNHDICINISNPALNGTYRPYATYQRTIPAATYFPDGMRSAGTVHDELTSDAAIVRVGAVDLGTLTWTMTEEGKFRVTENSILLWSTLVCTKYESYAGVLANMPDKSISATNSQATLLLRVYDSAYTDATTFKAAMQGVMLHYALATPTTQPISPALNLTYRTEQGGTESVMHTEQTAPPVMTVAQGPDANALRDSVLSAIAPVENGKASANYAEGSYLVHNGTLCKVTTALASGETIAIGTNVTATTVMAELLALTQ